MTDETDFDSAPKHAHPHLARRLCQPLGWGFALLIGLMVALLAHAVWHIHALKARMEHIVDIHNRKIQLATDLQEATYNRHAALVYQILTADPFERDDNFQLYIKWGYQVGKARKDLKAMPLDAFEQDNLSRQDTLVAEIVVLQEEIADLATQGRLEQAHGLMAARLRPLNLRFTETVEQLRRHVREGVLQALVDTQHASTQAIRFHLALGAIVLILAAIIALTTRRQLARHACIINRQVVDLEAAGRRLEYQATHDPLTGLANRALFHRRMAEGLEHAQQEKFMLGVMYLDLDDFKQVNDVHGHHVGDALLKEMARRLRHVVRASDTVARLGGDEFAIVLSGLETLAQCDAVQRKVEAAIIEPALLEGVPITPGGSVGCVLFPRDGQTLGDLLKVADQRMYETKHARKAAKAAGAFRAH